MSEPSQFAPFAPVLGLLLGLLCLMASMRAGKRRRLVDNLPTSRTTGVFIGLVELKGTAEVEQPLVSYLAVQPCVQYAWSVQEHWSRTVTETYTDSNGKTQTRTRHESGWTTVASGGEMIPFFLKDTEGVIRILPMGATLQPMGMFDTTCGLGDALYYGKGPQGAVSNSDFRRRFCETGIPLHTPLYVMGQARERDDMVAAEIAEDKNAPMFLISTKSEEQVSSGFAWAYIGWGILGGILGLAGIFARERMLNIESPVVLAYALVAGGYAMAWFLAWVWMVYNSMVDLRQRVNQGWSQVDVQLKRRHDLIPNLVQTIQGLRDYEQNLQVELAALRAQSTATPPGEPGPDYRACSQTLVAVAERYPAIKAQESFLNLQKNLADTEQRIALARGYFNDIATFYNTRLEVIPDRFIAVLAGMKPQALMAANEFERAPVVVELAS
jgi:hypothetical protein